jgi:hypothetical protein
MEGETSIEGGLELFQRCQEFVSKCQAFHGSVVRLFDAVVGVSKI